MVNYVVIFVGDGILVSFPFFVIFTEEGVIDISVLDRMGEKLFRDCPASNIVVSRLRVWSGHHLRGTDGSGRFCCRSYQAKAIISG